jgi:hypothetical protein
MRARAHVRWLLRAAPISLVRVRPLLVMAPDA